MAKKNEFSWEDEIEVGEVVINETKKVEISFCALTVKEEEKWYVSLKTLQFFAKKPEKDKNWHITKNFTCPRETFEEIIDIIAENLEEEE